MIEPAHKRAFAYIDGQNLFRCAKQAFGYSFPNYDVKALAENICIKNGWVLEKCCFYTGVPNSTDKRFDFWQKKISYMTRAGIEVFTRPLRYRNKIIRLPDGTEHSIMTAEEKGIDVRIALDVIRGAMNDFYDVAIVFSQDQDLSEVAKEIRTIANQKDRWMKIASAYPWSPASVNQRGINSTDWIQIPRDEYDKCLDRRDYR